MPPHQSTRRRLLRRVAALASVASVLTAGLVIASGAGPAAASPTVGGSAVIAPPAALSSGHPSASAAGRASGDETVNRLGLQARTVLYAPGVQHGGAAVAGVRPSASAPGSSGPAARADAGQNCSTGPAATICVSYAGFDAANLGPQFAQAHAAYQAAADVWANLLASPVTITIAVDVGALGAGVLAATGPNDQVQLNAGGPWYPVALANAVEGRDLDPAMPDIVSSFGDAADVSWYYGTDGNTPANKFDLESVALHEIGHGLGIFSLTDADDPAGNCALGCYGVGSFANLPSVYDTWLASPTTPGGSTLGWLTTGPQGQAGSFGNGTWALDQALTGGAVVWAGPEGIAAAGGARPRIYAPDPWNPGSSIAHLDQATYAWPNPNSALTPYVKQGEAQHAPGPIVLGMLRDLGWNETVASKISGAIAAGPTPDPAVGGVYVVWQPATRGIDGVSPVTGYRVQAGPNGSGPVVTATVPSTATSAVLTGLPTGVPCWVSVTALSTAGGPAYVAGVLPQDLGPSHTDLLSLLGAVVPNFVGHDDLSLAFRLAVELSSPNTSTTVEGLEVLNAFVLDPVLGPVTRLYEAYFRRLPDPGGTSYWLAALRSGTSLGAVSDYFAGSPEFVGTYGSLTDAQFLTQVYANILGRSPDPGGYAYWMGRLAAGMPRGTLMVNFSESSEFTARSAPTVLAVEGYWGMRHTIPTPPQVSATSSFSSGQVFGGLLDGTLS